MADWANNLGLLRFTYTFSQGDIATNTLYLACYDTLGNQVPTTLAQVQEVVQPAADSMAAFYGVLSFSTRCTFQLVDGYLIDKAAPHHALGKTSPGTNAVAGSGTNSMPPEVACVASLYGYDPTTLVADRKYKRGRIYLPGLATGPFDPNGLFSTSFTSYVSSGIAGVLDDISAVDVPGAPDLHLYGVIASRVTSNVTPIGWVRTDNHPDVIRKRQNAIGYNYSTETANTPA